MPTIVPLESVQQFQAVQLYADLGAIAGPKIIPNCCMVTLNWALTNGRTAHNVMYATWSGTPTLTQAIADSIRVALMTGGASTPFLALIAPTTSFAGVTLLDIRDATHSPITASGTTVGTGTGTALPDETAICVTLRTAERGQSGRGRIFIPGLTSTSVAAGGVVAAATITAINNWATTNLLPAITNNLGAASIGLAARNGYTSPVTGRVFPPRTARTIPITQALVRDNHWDSQRRRGLH